MRASIPCSGSYNFWERDRLLDTVRAAAAARGIKLSVYTRRRVPVFAPRLAPVPSTRSAAEEVTL